MVTPGVILNLPVLHTITIFGHVSHVRGVISPFMRHGRKFGVKIDDFGLKNDPSLLRNHGIRDPKSMFFRVFIDGQ